MEAEPSTSYLYCDVVPGMFKGELLVSFDGYHPKEPEKLITVQMLVDQQEVEKLDRIPQRDRPAKGWVRVTPSRERRGLMEIVLPQPAQPVGEIMLVEPGQLRAKPG